MSKQATCQDLRAAVVTMDAICNDGFGQIGAIARLALFALETPSGQINQEDIALGLNAIASLARDMAGAINGEAKAVDCAAEDERSHARLQALIAARSAGGAHA